MRNTGAKRNARLPQMRNVSLLVLASVALFLLAGCASQGSAPSTTSQTSRSSADNASLNAPLSANTSETAPPTTSSGANEGSGASTHTTLDGLAKDISADIKALAKSSDMEIGASFIDLRTGARAEYKASEQMASASMIKLLIAYAFLEQVAKGVYDLDDYYTIQSSDTVGGTGTLNSLGDGAKVTYREILEKTISESDNTGANILIELIGMETVNETARQLELIDTHLNRFMMDEEAIENGIENYSSANDVAALLQRVYNGTFVDSESSALVLKSLEEQRDDEGISEGLPGNIVFAHKTGALATVRHDGGIVEGSRPFVLVVFCGGSAFNEQDALDLMAQIAETVYDDSENAKS